MFPFSFLQGTALLTVDQRRWLDLKGRIKLAQPLRTPPRPENSKFRSYIFDITQNRLFKKSSAVLVLLNCALLYKPWKANEPITQISSFISSVFILLFLIEAIMKCTALGFVGYWQSRRNRFDLLVTILGIAWIVINIISMGKTDLVCSKRNETRKSNVFFRLSARVQQHIWIYRRDSSLFYDRRKTRQSSFLIKISIEFFSFRQR